MSFIRGRLTVVLILFSLVVTGVADSGSSKDIEESFKAVQNMLNLVRTEYIEDIPASQLLTGAFTNLGTALEEEGYTYSLPAVPKEIETAEAESFLKATFEKITSTHPKTLDENWLSHRIIEGMVEGLGDRYTVFMDPDEYSALKESMSGGNFGGVGIYIELKKEEGARLTVARPIPNTPASDAGIQVGDVILAIDGESTLDYTIEKAQEKLRGPMGSEVLLKIRRLTQAYPFEVTLKRDKIQVSSVSHFLRTQGDHRIGYIHLQMFGERTDQELEEVMRKYDADGADGYVLDLRNNGGGYIISAVDVVSKFVPTGSVVTSVEERGTGNRVYLSRPSIRDFKPLVVLINQNSASASEITAAALADHERASLFGVKTFGKGSVQKIFSLADGSGVKITTAHYHTPNGKDINEVGIEPNEEVEFEGQGLAADDDTQLLKAVEFLIEEIDAHREAISKASELPIARTGAEQWRYLRSLGRGEPEVIGRRYVLKDEPSQFLEELEVIFPDSFKSETIRFDLGPALGISS